MRSEPTDAERKMWNLLRDRQLANFKFRRQHPIGGFILDFYCPQVRLAVELDGGQHLDAEAILADQERTRKLAELGVRVIRFSDDEVLMHTLAVQDAIYLELERRMPSPQPSPGVPGEGVRAEPEGRMR